MEKPTGFLAKFQVLKAVYSDERIKNGIECEEIIIALGTIKRLVPTRKSFLTQLKLETGEEKL